MITGVDIPISKIRDDLADGLWTDVGNKIYYSRVMRDERLIEGTFELIPEVWTSGTEHKEVLFDDTLNVLVFFDVDENRSNVRDKPQTTISAVFAVNLETIYPGTGRTSEENVHSDVLQIFDQSRSSYKINEIDIVSGINAYGDFFRGNIKGFNMHPFHTFRMDLGIEYEYGCNDSDFNRGADKPYPDPVII